MITLLLILLPMGMGFAVWATRKNPRLAMAFLLVTALLHALGVLVLWASPGWEALAAPAWSSRWVGQDGISRVILSVTSVLFLGVAIHTRYWLPLEKCRHANSVERLLPDWVFIAGLLGFLGTMSLVASARNFGLLWVAVEATTLVSAPLILFHRSTHSLEAMWKYILICSVGIGFALFGTMLLAVAGEGGHIGLGMAELGRCGLHPAWFKAAFIFILAGYGTKMGLAPFHTWLPDAHSEAPGTVSALLSGALLNCSFLGIVRVWKIAPAGMLEFCNTLVIALGILSLATAAFFIIRQSDYKRMLAYSSVEHMGVIALLWSVGAEPAALLHLCTHSLLKMTLFLTAGNILLGCGTRRISELGGLFGPLPRNSTLWLIATLLICGLPPSPLFLTEFVLVTTAGPILGAAVLALLFAVFAGMTLNVLNMTAGPAGTCVPRPPAAAEAERLTQIPGMALALTLLAGIWLTLLFIRTL